MRTISKILLTTGLITTLIVSGCGRNDDAGPVATTPPTSTSVPDSAGVSAAAFIAYLMTLNPNDETSEPLTLSDSFAVPDDEANEPQPLA